VNSSLHTPVCDLLGCDYPIVLAGMGGVARSGLVAAVTIAGGFGFLGMVRESPSLIREEVSKVRAATTRDFGVSLIPAATAPDLLEAEIEICIGEHVPVVALFWDLSDVIVRRFRDAGILVVCQVGSAREAQDAQAAGAQILIAQGHEAGGHVRGRTKLSALLPEVVACADVPVLAAGGLVDGRDIAFVLAQGAQGAVIGTAFLATTESFAHDYHKNRIVKALANTTVYTDAFHVNWPRGAFVRVLPNSVTGGERGDAFAAERTLIGYEGKRPIWLFSTDSPLQSMSGDFEAMALYAGGGVGRIKSIVFAGERLRDMVDEAQAALPNPRLENLSASRQVNASPVCYAGESDDTYAGFATREEMLEFLNELLEAERAGARITARTASETSDPMMKSTMTNVYRDEVQWCAMLRKWIAHLKGAASPNVGLFYEKCLAIPDLSARGAFINRGQGWVTRKLRKMLPKIRDDIMHSDLTAMLKGHDENIARVNAVLNEPH
jgi:nitronate monooxygenase